VSWDNRFDWEYKTEIRHCEFGLIVAAVIIFWRKTTFIPETAHVNNRLPARAENCAASIILSALVIYGMQYRRDHVER